jgi:hypothetical protein
LSYVFVMNKRKGRDMMDEMDVDESSKSAMHLLSRVPDPLPNEKPMEYWSRVGALAAQATLVRALSGDPMASAAMFECVKAPVAAQVTMSQQTERIGRSNRLMQTLSGPSDDVSRLIASGKLSTAKAP